MVVRALAAAAATSCARRLASPHPLPPPPPLPPQNVSSAARELAGVADDASVSDCLHPPASPALFPSPPQPSLLPPSPPQPARPPACPAHPLAQPSHPPDRPAQPSTLHQQPTALPCPNRLPSPALPCPPLPRPQLQDTLRSLAGEVVATALQATGAAVDNLQDARECSLVCWLAGWVSGCGLGGKLWVGLLGGLLAGLQTAAWVAGCGLGWGRLGWLPRAGRLEAECSRRWGTERWALRGWALLGGGRGVRRDPLAPAQASGPCCIRMQRACERSPAGACACVCAHHKLTRMCARAATSLALPAGAGACACC